jgi:hypothetical protein
MDDPALTRQLSRIEFLLVIGVSCLSGLVFGRDYGGEAFFAVVSFFVLGVMLVLVRLQTRVSA